LALTSPTGGGRSVGIVRVRTKATEFSLVSLYMFREGSLLFIGRINSVQTATGIAMRCVGWLLLPAAASQHNAWLYQLRVDPPDKEQRAFSKYVETYY